MNVIREVLGFIFEIFFGCRHDHLSRPFTLQQQSYKVCLDCGKQLWYSPDTMRLLSARQVRRMQAIDAGEVKVIPAAAMPAANGPQLVPVSSRRPDSAA
ncbi:hypothetical protein [Paracidobacterium acidisoli]|uniref:Uncharacterized protein n=1 Tax=Paracidobacterium acidisoli TaxID=2303751 RepID=A0A372IQN3_9BACT|nr:hypothetical protein [Paracidobacterium acidisoli]MBT9331447.1 hypothetical protein [Paracidobacterium acidisoli]